jgi:hypothetical protein
MNTPTVATDGYAPGIAHCPTSNPMPPGGGAGTYQVTGTDSAGLAVVLFLYLVEIGWAKNFREIGNGTLTYSADGSPL